MASSTVVALETEVLENLITRGWHYLFRFQACLAEEKQELDGFLDAYYTQLGGWLQQAAQAAAAGEGGETTTALVNHLHHHHKFLYRELLKLCHPDVIAPHLRPYATEWIRQTREAYATGDGYYLVSLRNHIRRRSLLPMEYDQALRAEYLQLQAQVKSAREAVQKLRCSPAYHLQQRIHHARQRGFDLLTYIVNQLCSSAYAA